MWDFVVLTRFSIFVFQLIWSNPPCLLLLKFLAKFSSESPSVRGVEINHVDLTDSCETSRAIQKLFLWHFKGFFSFLSPFYSCKTFIRSFPFANWERSRCSSAISCLFRNDTLEKLFKIGLFNLFGTDGTFNLSPIKRQQSSSLTQIIEKRSKGHRGSWLFVPCSLLERRVNSPPSIEWWSISSQSLTCQISLCILLFLPRKRNGKPSQSSESKTLFSAWQIQSTTWKNRKSFKNANPHNRSTVNVANCCLLLNPSPPPPRDTLHYIVHCNESPAATINKVGINRYLEKEWTNSNSFSLLLALRFRDGSGTSTFYLIFKLYPRENGLRGQSKRHYFF